MKIEDVLRENYDEYANAQKENALLVQGDMYSLIRNIKDSSIDCIWTDPPYLLSNNGSTCVAGQRVSVNKGDWDKSGGINNDYQFNRSWLSECYRVLKPAGTIWVTGTVHVYLSVGMALLELGYRILNDIIWEKGNPPPNLGCRCFTHSTEVILWATKAPKKSKHKYTYHYKEMKAENNGKQMKNVWHFNAPAKKEKTLGKHPTQKPIQLVARSIRASTNPGDIVLDPFMGSGTTGVAALLHGRQFIGFEREDNYFSLAKRRLSVDVNQTIEIAGKPEGLSLF